MSVKIDDPYRDITPERWHGLLRYEYVLRAAARRRLFAALACCIAKVVERCIASKPTPTSVQARWFQKVLPTAYRVGG